MDQARGLVAATKATAAFINYCIVLAGQVKRTKGHAHMIQQSAYSSPTRLGNETKRNELVSVCVMAHGAASSLCRRA